MGWQFNIAAKAARARERESDEEVLKKELEEKRPAVDNCDVSNELKEGEERERESEKRN